MRLGTDGHKRGFARLNGRLDNMYHRVFCGEGRGRDRDRRARIRALCERRARPDMESPPRRPRANLAVFLTERGILGRQLGPLVTGEFLRSKLKGSQLQRRRPGLLTRRGELECA